MKELDSNREFGISKFDPFKKRKLAEIQKSFEKFSSSCKRQKDNDSKALPIKSMKQEIKHDRIVIKVSGLPENMKVSIQMMFDKRLDKHKEARENVSEHSSERRRH